MYGGTSYTGGGGYRSASSPSTTRAIASPTYTGFGTSSMSIFTSPTSSLTSSSASSSSPLASTSSSSVTSRIPVIASSSSSSSQQGGENHLIGLGMARAQPPRPSSLHISNNHFAVGSNGGRNGGGGPTSALPSHLTSSSSSSPPHHSSSPNGRKQNIMVEVVETDMTPGADGPIYHIKLDLNGRSYMAARHHNKLRGLVEGLRTRGYRILRPFPEVEDMMNNTPIKALEDSRLMDSLPFYEGFGYSIKSLATTVLKSSSALRGARKNFQMEQISQRIDGFLKNIFSENDDLQFEQEVYQFFWEPLEKKLPPLLEDREGEEGETEEVSSAAMQSLGYP